MSLAGSIVNEILIVCVCTQNVYLGSKNSINQVLLSPTDKACLSPFIKFFQFMNKFVDGKNMIKN